MIRANAAGGRTADSRGMWFGVSDDVLIPTIVRPVQFQDIWSSSRSISPERSLALAVVQEALDDLARYRFAKRQWRQRLYWDAYSWVATDDHEWPYSFVNLCEFVGLAIEPLRRRVLDPMIAPPLKKAA